MQLNRIAPRFITKMFLALSLTVSVLSLGGCIGTSFDVDSRGEIAIPAHVEALMRRKKTKATDPVFIRIFKQESELELWKQNRAGKFVLLKKYEMCRWSGELGPKKAEGDRQAPEGIYEVTLGRLNPNSKYFLSFDLGYPNKLERAKGYTGTALMVHGACSSSGCFAITDEQIAEVYALVREALRAGQPAVQVQSLPFRMTPENLANHYGNSNLSFWLDLNEASTRFDVLRRPPEFRFCEGRYRFGAVENPGADTGPLEQCPQLEQPPQKVSEKIAADLSSVEQLREEGGNIVSSYADGGMHSKFRNVLLEKGAEFLARKTSSSAVPVSRPKAALSDPFNPLLSRQ
jgi:murein L,D-transpeptidase YafK